MKLTILGSGTVDPLAHRACSGYFLETASEDVIFDLGNGTVRRAQELGVPVHAARRVFFSHLHPDHTSDLVTFLFARKYAPAPWSRESALTLYGPPGFTSFLESVFCAWPSIRPGEDDSHFEVVEVPEFGGVAFESEDYRVEAVAVEHGDMLAFGFRFLEGERVLAYSGDTRLCEGVKTVAKGADLFLCECSCFPIGCEPLYCREVHLSWEDVAEICSLSGVKEVVLTHLYEPVLARSPNPLDSLREALEIPVSLAFDGLSFSLCGVR